jgi:hypothetical protein
VSAWFEQRHAKSFARRGNRRDGAAGSAAINYQVVALHLLRRGAQRRANQNNRKAKHGSVYQTSFSAICKLRG